MRQSILKLFRRHAKQVAQQIASQLDDQAREQATAYILKGVVDGHRRTRLTLDHRMRGVQTRYVKRQINPRIDAKTGVGW